MTFSTASKGRISIDNLSVTFSSRGRDLSAVSDINVSITPGAFVCLLGPSGCGKSTLLNCIAGFVRPTLGSVSVDGQLVDQPGPDRGMVFQNHSLFPWKTVLKNVSLGPEISARSGSSPEATARTFLNMVGLSEYEDYYPNELSGGMQQRVGIARAVVNKPPILLADEPTGNLDPQLSGEIMTLFRQFNAVGVTTLIATHDLHLVKQSGKRVLTLSDGQLVHDGLLFDDASESEVYV